MWNLINIILLLFVFFGVIYVFGTTKGYATVNGFNLNNPEFKKKYDECQKLYNTFKNTDNDTSRPMMLVYAITLLPLIYYGWVCTTISVILVLVLIAVRNSVNKKTLEEYIKPDEA